MKTLIIFAAIAISGAAFADTRICGTLVNLWTPSADCQPDDLSCAHSGGGNGRNLLQLQLDDASGDLIIVTSANETVDKAFARSVNKHVCLYGQYTQQNKFYASRVSNN